jgi:hypothetical protein
MTASVTHAQVVVTADDGTSEVGSDEWNAGHVIDLNGVETDYTVTGAELVADSDLSTDPAMSGWTLGAAASYNAGQGRVDFSGSAFTNYVQFDFATTAGATYLLDVVGSITGEVWGFYLFNNDRSYRRTSSSFKIAFIAGSTGTETCQVYFSNNNNAGASGYVTSVSIKAISAISPGLMVQDYGGESVLKLGANSDNTLLGAGAGTSLTYGVGNVAIGRHALRAETTGTSQIAIGQSALQYANGTETNIAIGDEALKYTTTGLNNVAIGPAVLRGNTTGIKNVGIGYGLIVANGSYNVAIGHNVLLDVTDGEENTALGHDALQNVTSGDRNIGIGGTGTTGAGNTITTGSRNICIGDAADTPLNSTNDYLNIGNVIKGDMAAGPLTFMKVPAITALAFASLPGTPVAGMMAYVNNSSTATWGATIAGGGANHVLAWYNGANWTVVGA